MLKYNELQVRIAPSPVGEGWGEENKIKALPLFPSSNLFSLWRRLLNLCRYLCLIRGGIILNIFTDSEHGNKI